MVVEAGSKIRRCQWPVNGYVLNSTLFVTIAAVTTGLTTGSQNGILEMDGFQDAFRQLYTSNEENSSNDNVCSSGNGASSDNIIGLIVSIAGIGATIGSLIAGWLSDVLSRKYTLSLGGLSALVGAVLLSSAFYIWMLLLGRFLLGMAMGVSYVVMPMYLSEMSPKEHRGALSSIMGPAFNGGILFALCLNVGFSKFPLGWRIASLTVAVSALIYTIGMVFLPHTPRWLVRRGRDKEALAVLTKINRNSSKETFVNTCFELKELQADTEAGSGQSLVPMLKELKNWKYRLLFCAVIFICDSAVGGFLVYFSSTFFCEVGISPFYGALIIGTIILVTSTIMLPFVDKLGRRGLFLFSIPISFFSGLTIAILVHLNLDHPVADYAVVVLLCIYAFAFPLSFLTIPWVITSELFPNYIRSATVAISAAIYWTSAAVVNQLTLPIVGFIDIHGFFYILTGVNLFAFFFILLLLPETKGTSLEQTDSIFSKSIWNQFMRYLKFRYKDSVQVQGEQELSMKVET